MNYVYSISWGIFAFIIASLGLAFLSKKPGYLLEAASSDTKIFKLNPTIFNHLFITVSVILACICGFLKSRTDIDILDEINLISSFGLLTLATITDIHSHRIPNTIPLCMIFVRILVFASYLILQRENWEAQFASSLAISLLMLLVFYCASRFMRGGIGLGDVKIIAALTFMRGLQTGFSIVFVSIIICAIFAVLLLITKSKHLKDEIPFGPFLFIANVFALFLGL